jgi:hypothetical protein
VLQALRLGLPLLVSAQSLPCLRLECAPPEVATIVDARLPRDAMASALAAFTRMARLRPPAVAVRIGHFVERALSRRALASRMCEALRLCEPPHGAALEEPSQHGERCARAHAHWEAVRFGGQAGASDAHGRGSAGADGEAEARRQRRLARMERRQREEEPVITA